MKPREAQSGCDWSGRRALSIADGRRFVSQRPSDSLCTAKTSPWPDSRKVWNASLRLFGNRDSRAMALSRMHSAMFHHTLCYSVKANSNLSILRMLAREGCGFDVVSGGELERVLTADRTAAAELFFPAWEKLAMK